MVVLPEFVFVAAPRTGSRSIRDALLTMPGAVASRTHHTPWADVPTDRPIYAVTRHPLQIMITWWTTIRNSYDCDFRAFCRENAGGPFRPPWGTGLHPYDMLQPRYFVFEKGLQNALETLGCGIAVPHVGASLDRYKPTRADVRVCEEVFAADYKRYEEINCAGMD